MEVTQEQLNLLNLIPFLLGQTTSHVNARVYLNGSQTLSSGNPVAFDTVSFINGITFNATASSLVIQTAGQYHVGGMITWQTAAAGKQASANIYLNASQHSTGYVSTDTTNQNSAYVSDILNLKQGDALTLVGTYTFASGVLDNASQYNYLFAYKI